MPELPEVETLKLGLRTYILGKKILSITVHDRNVFSGDEKHAVGGTITSIRRFAKGIVIDLSNDYSFAVHVKLTGQLIFRNKENKEQLVLKPSPIPVPNKFTRVTIKLGDSFLYFQEVRGFAWMKLLKTSDISSLQFFKTLGPEPPIGQDDSGLPKLTEEVFISILSASQLPIKQLLMEQTRIGGVGNIYANDACFSSHIDPRRRAKTLSKEETHDLYKALIEVLKKGLKYRGSSELNFVDVLGNTGEYQTYMLVYGKKGKPCIRNDGGVIEKIYLGGRGTFFCPVCQH